jgi:hypothetical protein
MSIHVTLLVRAQRRVLNGLQGSLDAFQASEHTCRHLSDWDIGSPTGAATRLRLAGGTSSLSLGHSLSHSESSRGNSICQRPRRESADAANAARKLALHLVWLGFHPGYLGLDDDELVPAELCQAAMRTSRLSVASPPLGSRAIRRSINSRPVSFHSGVGHVNQACHDLIEGHCAL